MRVVRLTDREIGILTGALMRTAELIEREKAWSKSPDFIVPDELWTIGQKLQGKTTPEWERAAQAAFDADRATKIAIHKVKNEISQTDHVSANAGGNEDRDRVPLDPERPDDSVGVSQAPQRRAGRSAWKGYFGKP